MSGDWFRCAFLEIFKMFTETVTQSTAPMADVYVEIYTTATD